MSRVFDGCVRRRTGVVVVDVGASEVGRSEGRTTGSPTVVGGAERGDDPTLHALQVTSAAMQKTSTCVRTESAAVPGRRDRSSCDHGREHTERPVRGGKGTSQGPVRTWFHCSRNTLNALVSALSIAPVNQALVRAIRDT